MSELNAGLTRLNSLMAKGIKNKLVIPYFISMGFTAVSINSIARGIENHETWRIVTAAIGGSFFLGIAVLMMVRLVKESRKTGLKRAISSQRAYVRSGGDQDKG